MKSIYKRVCVITLEVKDENGKIIQSAGIVMRVTKAMADYWVSNHSARYTTKAKLHSYSKMDNQINSNLRYLDNRGIMIGQANEKGETKLYNFTTKTETVDEKPVTTKVKGKVVGEVVWSPYSGKVYAKMHYMDRHLSTKEQNPVLKGSVHQKEDIPEYLIVGKQARL